jgi:hypothetical protein
MRLAVEIACAVLAIAGVLIVFTCPLTVVPPAPSVKYAPLALLFLGVVVALRALIRPATSECLCPVEPYRTAVPMPDRLAMICSFLC